MRARAAAFLPVLVASACWHADPKPPAAEHDAGSPDGNSATVDVDAHPDRSATRDGPAVDASPPVRPAGCDTPDALFESTVFSDGFESYPLGPFENVPGSPWVRASMGRDVEISSAAASSGTNSLLIQSLDPKTETDYVPLAIDPLPPRISFQATFLLDGFIKYESFGGWGLAVVRSKYDLQTVLQLAMSGHELTLVPTDGSPSVTLFSELDYGDPPRANTVRVDLDLCGWKAAVSVGVPTSPLALRATVDVQPFSSVSALWISAGLNQVYVDDVSVTVRAP